MLPMASTSVSYRLDASVGSVHDPVRAIDRRHLHAGVQGHALLRVPVERIDEDVRGLLRTREDAREQDAVVVAERLLAEDRDLVSVATAAREHVFDQARPRHPVSDDDQPMFAVHVLDNSGLRATGYGLRATGYGWSPGA